MELSVLPATPVSQENIETYDSLDTHSSYEKIGQVRLRKTLQIEANRCTANRAETALWIVIWSQVFRGLTAMMGTELLVQRRRHKRTRWLNGLSGSHVLDSASRIRSLCFSPLPAPDSEGLLARAPAIRDDPATGPSA